MSQNSPNLSDQLKKMQTEAQTLEQKIQHRKNEAQAVQESLTQLQAEFDRNTIRLLAEQTATLDATKVIFENEQADLKETIEKQSLVIDRNNTKITEQDKALELATNAVSQIIYEIEREERALTDAKQQTDKLIRSKSELSADKLALELSITLLEERKLTVETEAVEQIKAKGLIIDDINELQEVYDKDKLDKDQTIAFLNTKILDLSQKATVIQDKERLIRTDLATWQESLAEKDKNLRLRERKVEQGEDKIVQNANLLNL